MFESNIVSSLAIVQQFFLDAVKFGKIKWWFTSWIFLYQVYAAGDILI